MKKALFLAVLLGAGALLASYHVANQHYYPVTRLESTDGYTFHLVQDRVKSRNQCGKANDFFLGPLKERCAQCRIAYARCERELQGLELKLLMGEPLPLHVVVAGGFRMALEGPQRTVRRDCEDMAALIVRAGAPSAACAYPGTMRRP